MVARFERNISSIEVRAADRDKRLVQELQNLQEQNMAMQRDHAGNVSIAEAIQAQRLQATYANEIAEFARTNQELLSDEFSKNFTKFGREEEFRFARTEDEMRAQNDGLQEELLSAERALRFFRNEARPSEVPVPSTPLSRGSGYTGLRIPPGPTAPPGPQVPDPCVIPDSMRGLFSQMNPVQQLLNHKSHQVSPGLQVRLDQLLVPRPPKSPKVRWLPILP